MKICVTCRREMKCVKTGAKAVWHGHHIYAGDRYECQTCGAHIMVCNENPYQSDIDLSEHPCALNMTPEGDSADLG